MPALLYYMCVCVCVHLLWVYLSGQVMGWYSMYCWNFTGHDTFYREREREREVRRLVHTLHSHVRLAGVCTIQWVWLARAVRGKPVVHKSLFTGRGLDREAQFEDKQSKSYVYIYIQSSSWRVFVFLSPTNLVAKDGQSLAIDLSTHTVIMTTYIRLSLSSSSYLLCLFHSWNCRDSRTTAPLSPDTTRDSTHLTTLFLYAWPLNISTIIA